MQQPQIAQIISQSGQIPLQLAQISGLGQANIISQGGQANMMQSSQASMIQASQASIISQANIMHTSQGNILQVKEKLCEEPVRGTRTHITIKFTLVKLNICETSTCVVCFISGATVVYCHDFFCKKKTFKKF